MSSSESNTGQTGPDFTHYNELKQQAIAQTSEVQRVVANKFVPLLYDELIKQGLKPKQAASRIYKDFVPMWHHDTILHILPPEARRVDKAPGGRKSQEVQELKRLTQPKHMILVKLEQVLEINNASHLSVDGSVWILTNSKFSYLKSVPVTAKSVIAEPVAVKPETTEPIIAKSSSAPIRSA